jgi:hypothetical protein
VRITDFGIARAEAELGFQTTQSGIVKGSPRFMAPEVLLENNIAGHSDQFSVGVVLYELLTGVALYRGQTLPEILMLAMQANVDEQLAAIDAPRPLVAVLRRMLSRSPADRYPDHEQAALALASVPLVGVRVHHMLSELLARTALRDDVPDEEDPRPGCDPHFARGGVTTPIEEPLAAADTLSIRGRSLSTAPGFTDEVEISEESYFPTEVTEDTRDEVTSAARRGALAHPPTLRGLDVSSPPRAPLWPMAMDPEHGFDADGPTQLMLTHSGAPRTPPPIGAFGLGPARSHAPSTLPQEPDPESEAPTFVMRGPAREPDVPASELPTTWLRKSDREAGALSTSATPLTPVPATEPRRDEGVGAGPSILLTVALVLVSVPLVLAAAIAVGLVLSAWLGS